jgi:hypothetical protein
MSGALRKSSPSWRKAAEANGFGILCIKGTDGERFSIALLDAGRFSKFAARGLRAGLSMTETELRAQLVQAGFSEPDIEAGIQLSRDWATLIKKSSASRN